jgi:prepilin-type N-terminal cleavage/methylation domain-containing protein
VKVKQITIHNSGFTIVELLVTISIIVVLVSTLTLALASARTSAQVAETRSRLTSLKNATILFKEDVGYLPAVLDSQRSLSISQIKNISKYFQEPEPETGTPTDTYRYVVQEWYSITSPAEFFIGYGNRDQDGYGRVVGSLPDNDEYPDYKELPRVGIRHPSIDGVWRATDALELPARIGLLSDRVPSTRGDLIGPYLEVENDQMYGRLIFDGPEGITGDPLVDPVTGQVKVFYPGDPEMEPFTIVEQQAFPMVIVDTWGSPIRYYRPLYPVANTDPLNLLPLTGIASSYRQSNNSDYARPTLSDYFVLRPFDFQPDKVIDGSRSDYMNGLNDTSGDRSTTFELQVGQFAYFSAGPDQKSNDLIRADMLGLPGNNGINATQEVNEDNIVEIGP